MQSEKKTQAFGVVVSVPIYICVCVRIPDLAVLPVGQYTECSGFKLALKYMLNFKDMSGCILIGVLV